MPDKPLDPYAADFCLCFTTDNASFQDAPAFEVAKLIRKIADGLEHHGMTQGVVHDDNGNRIGWWNFDHPDPNVELEDHER